MGSAKKADSVVPVIRFKATIVGVFLLGIIFGMVVEFLVDIFTKRKEDEEILDGYLINLTDKGED